MPRNSEIQDAALHLYKLLSTRPAAVPGSGNARQKLPVGSQRELERASAKLSAMVLRPVAAQLHVKRIVVVADGALQYIPFAMLPDPSTAGDRVHPHPGVPLIVNHEVVNLPSASVLSALRRQGTPGPGRQKPWQFWPIPSSQKMIRACLPKQRRQPQSPPLVHRLKKIVSQPTC